MKENDLAHGEFGKWLETVNLNQSTANKMMKVSRELNSYTYTNSGLNALDMIATLPEEERNKEHGNANINSRLHLAITLF